MLYVLITREVELTTDKSFGLGNHCLAAIKGAAPDQTVAMVTVRLYIEDPVDILHYIKSILLKTVEPAFFSKEKRSIMLKDSVSLYLEDSDDERTDEIEDEVSYTVPDAALNTTRRGRSVELPSIYPDQHA